MKKYETLTLEIAMLDSSDVIATSADVTTGGITMPWQTDDGATPAGLDFITGAQASSYNLN